MNNSSHTVEIALVEDDTMLREELARFLSEQNYIIHQANNGLSLEETLLGRDIGLIVLDLNLPGISGHEIAKKVRETRPEIGIIMLTARTSLTDRIKSYESGADIYLPKPTPPQELLAAINSLVNRIHLSKSDTWILQMHSSQLISPNGKNKILLLAIECLLLKALAHAENNSLESESICELLSGQLSMELMTKRALENVVSRFRKKLLPLADNEEINAIQSVRGSGYRLCLPLKIVSG